MSLGNSSHGGVAGHLRNEIGVEGEERGAKAHARGGHGSFAAGVSGTDYGNIVMF
jgi:hypothetical protein